jgi:hypothetical protein
MIAQAQAEVRTQCEKAQKTTEEVSNGYQNQLKGINARHAALVQRLRQCESVRVTKAPGGRDATATGNELPEPNPVPAVDLLNLFRIADQQTAQLQACQDFIRRLP